MSDSEDAKPTTLIIEYEGCLRGTSTLRHTLYDEYDPEVYGVVVEPHGAITVRRRDPVRPLGNGKFVKSYAHGVWRIAEITEESSDEEE